MRTEEWITEVRELARYTASCAVGVTSADREVTVTVGPGGVPREITFTGSAARLDGEGLARLVLDTLHAAAARVDQRLTARLGEHAGLFRGDLPQPPTPDAPERATPEASPNPGRGLGASPTGPAAPHGGPLQGAMLGATAAHGGPGAREPDRPVARPDGPVRAHAGSRPSGGAGTEPGGGAGPGPRREAAPGARATVVPELERMRDLLAARAAVSDRLRTAAGQDHTLVENSDGRIRILVRGVTVERLSLADGLLAEYGAEALGMLLVSLIQGAIARSAARVAELAGELTGTRLAVPGWGPR
ncbi:hypothetical protein R8Z50_29205 [Longispora sp. K20-0274]|uniref:hypothetical protein n=1 Tax=Longispora sp. K20-0274 TaxID=3088255 RepID=UPI00399BDEB4